MYIIPLLVLWSVNLYSGSRIFKCSETLDNPYGICSHISRVGWDYEYCDGDIAVIKKLGIGNVRTDFDFAEGKDRISGPFKVWDLITRKCNDAGIEILPIITQPVNKTRLDDWKSDISGIVSRYRGMRYWEIINEPDIAYKNAKWPSAGEYAELLDKAYSSVKRSNSKATVLSGGFGQSQDDYFPAVIERKPKFDVLNIHYYDTKQAPETFWNYLKFIGGEMASNGISCPVWLTETGYSTVGYGFGQEDFFNATLPKALSKLGCRASVVKVAVVSDIRRGFIVPGDVLDENVFKNVTYITLDEIEGLNPAKVPVLIPTLDESFPMEFIRPLLDYVRKGGTIVLHGGAPLFYDRLLDGTGRNVAVGDKYLADFHLAVQFPWQVSAKLKGVPENSRYLLQSKLSGRDSLIPLTLSEDGKNVVSGIYRLNSSLKGNIIVNADVDERGVCYKAQAERLPRMFLISFAAGMEKVFWYHLRSFEKDMKDFESHLGIVHRDFTAKPAYYSYKTLVQMCPDRSTRPKLDISEDGVFEAKWRRPDGAGVTAVWTCGKKVPCDYSLNRNTLAYDAYGKPVTTKRITASSNITYIVSR